MEERSNKPGQARARRAGNRRKKRHYRQNKVGMLCISCIVLFLLAAMFVQIYHLHQKNDGYIAKEKELTAQLQEEQERQEDIRAYEAYVTTPEYIEQMAKTKLGLVYSNEIIFKEKKAGE